MGINQPFRGFMMTNEMMLIKLSSQNLAHDKASVDAATTTIILITITVISPLCSLSPSLPHPHKKYHKTREKAEQETRESHVVEEMIPIWVSLELYADVAKGIRVALSSAVLLSTCFVVDQHPNLHHRPGCRKHVLNYITHWMKRIQIHNECFLKPCVVKLHHQLGLAPY